MSFTWLPRSGLDLLDRSSNLLQSLGGGSRGTGRVRALTSFLVLLEKPLGLTKRLNLFLEPLAMVNITGSRSGFINDRLQSSRSG